MLSFKRKASLRGAHSTNEAELKAGVVDKLSSPVMMVDRDLVVTYVNQPTIDLFTKNERAFRENWPDFDASKIVGTCIDRFHKNPQHQRQLLADPSRFPLRANISVGPVKIALLVNGVFDARGKYVGSMLEWRDVTDEWLKEGLLNAIDRAQACIEFGMDGTIETANENFLKTIGYTLEEIRGKPHSMFVDPGYRNSADYRAFWDKLRRGEFQAGQFQRIGKGGKEVWLEASYNPILDPSGKPLKVIKCATDVTANVLANRAMQIAVQQTQEVIKAAERNDLTVRIPMEGKSGEIATLCSGVNALLDTMAGVIRKIKDAAREVSNASAEIAASTTDLSQRTEEQAASLEQTSASMEEVSSTVKRNAENAQQANQSASTTREVADRGGRVVGQAVEAMARIEESSRKISDIIGVIDEIARQTNLLALNAAVEAARAGDAGRGFAVVASEVRSLAQRSSQAAKDIKDLITNSNGQVKDGVDLVNRAGAALNEIVESIKAVAGVISEIATASVEQSTGLEEINRALNQMDEVTQQNSALVEQNAATAKTLEQQAAAMSAEVNNFRVDDGRDVEPGARRAPPSRPSAPPVRARAAAKPAAKPAAKTAAVRRGAVGGMQAAVAAAFQAEEWKDF